jgi:hypothetical protein
MGFVSEWDHRMMWPMRRAGLLLSMAFLFWFPQVALGSVVVALSVEEMAQRADLIVMGEVVSVQTSWSSDHRHIYRRVVVNAEEAWKGPIDPGTQVTLVVPGGDLEGVSEKVIGEPPFVAGMRGAFFLERAGSTHRLIGLSQGFFESSAQGLVQRTGGLALAHPSASGYRISAHGAEAAAPTTVDALRSQVLGALHPADVVTPSSR